MTIISADDFVAHIKQRLAPGFQTQLFEAALMNFRHLDNPLRLNNFAYALRELIRHVLADLAPDASVRACNWFTPDVTASSSSGITRRHRIVFAIQGGLSSDFVARELNLDLSNGIKKTLDLVGELSKYTHINAETFDLPDTIAEETFVASIETVNQIFDLIHTLRHSVRTAVHDAVSDELCELLYTNVFDDLDILSTHTTVDEANLDKFWVDTIDQEFIFFEGTGTVDSVLQYGSNSDVKQDMGFVKGDSYPFHFRARAFVDTPHEIMINMQDITIDTSKWDS